MTRPSIPTVGTRWRHKTLGGTYELIDVDVLRGIYTLERLTVGATTWQELDAEAKRAGASIRETVEAFLRLPVPVDLRWFELNGVMIR